MPFDITAEAIELFTENDSGMVYSATGVTFQLKRNSLGLLLSRFYGPMACFAFLSVLSYNINIDMVNMNIIFIKGIGIQISLLYFQFRSQVEWV